MRSTRTIIIRRTVGFLAGALLAAAFTGCSGNGNQGTEAQTTAAAETQETSAAAETTAQDANVSGRNESETAADSQNASDEQSYQSKDGWSVRYDASLIEVKEEDGAAAFIYKNDSAENSMVTIRTVSGKQPEEALAELTSEWGEDDSIQEKIHRSEGFFPGTSDKWGYWRTLHGTTDGTEPDRTAIAGEYNGGVLIFEFTSFRTGDDGIDMAQSDVLAEIVDSVAYEKFEAQSLYEGIAGEYYAEEDEETGETCTLSLKEDHTGVLHLQNDSRILWGSIRLTAANPADPSYEYTREGDTMLIKLDQENWVPFRKELPAYEYPGPEQFYYILYDYIVKEIGSTYARADVGIPAPVILEVDESDPEDVLVYGNFWYYNYNLEGKTLQTQSGGACPGCMHMKKGEGGYEIVSMERTTDGAGYEESAKKIFGSRYSEFEKLNSDDQQREQIRAQVIANYVEANELDITEYQDYGWDPVELPEENIDSFYSQLD